MLSKDTQIRLLAAWFLAATATAAPAASPDTAVTDIAAASLPCDLYEAGKTPCVAAHSTTRALYAAFSGALYQVTRKSDGATKEINTLSRGGVADADAQDKFCSGATCVISIIYDQSPKGNHLTRAPKGAFSGPGPNGADDLASAVGAPVLLDGKKAYGVFIPPGTGYRNNAAKGTATGDGKEGIYSIFDSAHTGPDCCFDYGNAETSSHDTGNGHMEAVYFGTAGVGPGDGPWIKADLENGLFTNGDGHKNTNSPTQTSRFVTAMLKGEPNHWSIRGGDATKGDLSTYWDGKRPANGYYPMHEEGAIILGIGGDNSDRAQGTWYEGVMTAGYPSDATENKVQASIVSAKYAGGQLNTGSQLKVGSDVSIKVATPGVVNRYFSHNGTTVETYTVDSSSSAADKKAATWTVRAGLGNKECYSFESVETPGSFIRHQYSHLLLNKNDNSQLFKDDSTFCTEKALNGHGDSIRSWSYPTRYFRHYETIGYIAAQGGPNNFDTTEDYANQVSFLFGAANF